MFGFQRIGDLAWAAGDSQARGFLIGATAGRTTLNGEGLQHQDGHSQLIAATIPNCISYDPAYAYELAVIIQDGMRRMFEESENCFYYITTMNENYLHPDMPEGVEEGIVRGLYPLSMAEEPGELHVQLIGCGSILREVIAAAELLREEFGVSADIWSATSFNELCREGQDTDRWNTLHPESQPRTAYVTRCLSERPPGPAVAASDYVKAYAEQIRPWLKRPYYVLGTDGYGRSDTRPRLRHFFEVDRRWVTVQALKALADGGKLPASRVSEAMKVFGIDPEKPNPVTV